MAKRWRCYLAFHTWQQIRNDEGKWYKRCQACGKFSDIPDRSGGFGGAGGGG